MRRPQPSRLSTDREIAAATFAFTHYAWTNIIGRDAWQFFTVQRARRDYVYAARSDELRRAA